MTYGGRPHIVTIDELGSGGVKFSDVTSVNKPRHVAQIKLEINLPSNLDTTCGRRWAAACSAATRTTVPSIVRRIRHPLACSWESTDIRVVDIRNTKKIKGVGYVNPPAVNPSAQKNATVSGLPNSPHVLVSISGAPAVEFLSFGMAVLNGKVSLADTIGPRSGMVVGGDLPTDWC